MPQQFDFPGRRSVPQIKLSPKMVYGVIAVLFGLWLISGIYQVEPDEQGVKMQRSLMQEPLFSHGDQGVKIDTVKICLRDRGR